MASSSSPLPRKAAQPEPSVRLRVARARVGDIGTGTARLGLGAFRQLGLVVGDVIEIAGRRRTAAVARRLQFEDRGLEVVRIEGLVRANAGAVIGEDIVVRRLTVPDARRVTLVLAHPGAAAAEVPDWKLDGVQHPLVGRLVTRGDLTVVPCLRADRCAPLPLSAVSEPRRQGLTGVAPIEVQFRVASTEPEGSVRILPTTEIEVVADLPTGARVRRIGVTYEDVGGLANVIAQLRETVELPLARPDLFRQLGIAPSRGVLLHGPPGSGKTLLASAVAGETGARFLVVDSAAFDDGEASSFERVIAEAFQQAREQPPAIILVDGLDAIAPARGGRVALDRGVTQLLAHMKELGPNDDIIVIGTANTADAVDGALRRTGVFEREIAVELLDTPGRREVLAIRARHVPLAADVDLDHLSRVTTAFSGGDVTALVRGAGVAALRRMLAPGTGALQSGTSAVPLEVKQQDFEVALTQVRPAALRDHAVQIQAVRWSDIGGLEDVKRALRDGIELPLKHAEAFARLGIRASKGFLLFGPPGTGKTMLARAVAHGSCANFISVKPSDILSKWYGESERHVAQLFARARHLAPAILFFDEIEAIAPRRGAGAGEPAVTERVVNAILMELDGIEELQGVVVVGATNQPALIDPALLRPGRIDELLYVAAPNDAERLGILGVVAGRMPLARDVDLRELASRTNGYTGADLESLVRRAGFRAFCDNAEACEVGWTHFEKALSESRPSVTPSIEREFNAILETLRLDGIPRRDAIGFTVTGES